MDEDELRRQLAEAGERRARAVAARDAASAELAPLLQAATERDIPVAEMARIAQLSRPAVYELRRKAASSEAPAAVGAHER